MSERDAKVGSSALPDVYADREFAFTDRDFRQIADTLHEEAGIALTDVKAALVYSRLARRLRELGLESFKQYCELVNSNTGFLEREHMVAALTTNVTRFFREPHHFEHLKSHVLPELLDDVRRGGRLRIWSAGCSTGEEPYSIALTVLSIMPDAADFDVKILATDINKSVLERAEKGIYVEGALAPVSWPQLSRWFARVDGSDGDRAWSVGDELRALVAFRELNLMSDWPMKMSYQAIFCRNVVIYFEEQVRSLLWTRLEGFLAPRGCLYVGCSERIANDRSFQVEGNTTYRLKAPKTLTEVH